MDTNELIGGKEHKGRHFGSAAEFIGIMKIKSEVPVRGNHGFKLTIKILNGRRGNGF